MKKKKLSIIKRLMEYGGNKKYMLYLALLCSATSAVLLLLPMFYIHRIVQNLIFVGNTDYEFVKENAIYAAVFPAIGIIFYIFSGIISHIFAFEVEDNIIKINVTKLMKKPLGYFSNIESGKIRNIIIGGASETHTILAHQLPDFASTIVSPIVVLILLFVFDWRLGMASIIPVIISAVLMSTMMTSSAKKEREIYYENINNLSAETVEYVRGIPIVKTFGQSVESFKRLHSSIIRMRESVLRMTMLYRNKMSLFEVISSSVAFFIIPVGLYLVLKGLNVQEVISNVVIYLLIGPIFGVLIMRSAVMGNYIYFAEQALDKIEDVLNYPEMKYGNNKISQGGIEFRNVSFSYDNERVLKDISFTVNEGEMVALVGKSGSGKSTIAKLAARFYDVNEGEILIGGINIKNYDKKYLMKEMAFVFQNTNLFKKSLKENILIGNEDASDEEIVSALNNAGAMEIIDNLDSGLNTIYGKKGTYLSGGEMQRIAIARTFLKNAKYIILDEATAFSDPENEHIIQKSFKRLSDNKTTLMIAHRLSTVIDADRILVIEDGRIVEEGKHIELLKINGVYKQLWDEYQRSINWKIGGNND
ncbi:ABC transporter ATP-binding protein [Faecalicoccus sp.]|uniref:ABC transporter ATP-binding protein n=1 Tax=Faecalicoccus sp. TaxID=1971758 RepID=UPI002A80ECE9|nr:ABC transporter ATP-binding protein [Faecalicoccus sp.]MDY5111420.1 ABC transporter ATP-binding protein [Faecalicoccus sp.]